MYRLQLIDSQISQVEAQLKEIERLLAGDETVQQAAKEAADCKDHLQRARQALKESEFSVREQALKIEQNEASLYGGKVRNPKELQDLQKDITSLKKHLGVLEDRQLERMLTVEEAEQASQEAESRYQKAHVAFIERSAGWRGQRDAHQRNIERLMAERAPALAFVTADSLATYNRLRQRKNGIGVVSVTDGSCSLCGGTIRPSEVQAARTTTSLEFCSSCGRILYAG